MGDLQDNQAFILPVGTAGVTRVALAGETTAAKEALNDLVLRVASGKWSVTISPCGCGADIRKRVSSKLTRGDHAWQANRV